MLPTLTKDEKATRDYTRGRTQREVTKDAGQVARDFGDAITEDLFRDVPSQAPKDNNMKRGQ